MTMTVTAFRDKNLISKNNNNKDTSENIVVPLRQVFLIHQTDLHCLFINVCGQNRNLSSLCILMSASYWLFHGKNIFYCQSVSGYFYVFQACILVLYRYRCHDWLNMCLHGFCCNYSLFIIHYKQEKRMWNTCWWYCYTQYLLLFYHLLSTTELYLRTVLWFFEVRFGDFFYFCYSYNDI